MFQLSYIRVGDLCAAGITYKAACTAYGRVGGQLIGFYGESVVRFDTSIFNVRHIGVYHAEQIGQIDVQPGKVAQDTDTLRGICQSTGVYPPGKTACIRLTFYGAEIIDSVVIVFPAALVVHRSTLEVGCKAAGNITGHAAAVHIRNRTVCVAGNQVADGINQLALEA